MKLIFPKITKKKHFLDAFLKKLINQSLFQEKGKKYSDFVAK